MEEPPPIVQEPTNEAKSQLLTSGVQEPINGQPGPGLPPLLIPPPPIPGVPIGLEPLIPLDHIFIRQKIELLEVITGFETANRYDVFDGIGQRIFFAVETTGCCARYWCGGCRQFTIDIIDFFGRTVMSIHRVYRWCRGDDMFVTLGDGTKLGTITHSNCWLARFDVKNANDDLLMKIRGPCCVGWCGCTFEYPVSTINGEQLGVIRKTFSGLVQEFFTDADNFGVEFSRHLDVPSKVLMFAAVFLIDFLYFEHH